MPQIKLFFKTLLCLCLLSSFASAQSKAVKLNQGAADPCRLFKTLYSYPADGSLFTTTFEVDKQSRLVKEVSTYKHGDGKRDRERTTTNTYDAAGFLTRRVAITVCVVPNAYSEKSSVDKFTYADGRLHVTETAITYEDASQNVTYQSENKYDKSGNLTEQIVTSNGDAVRYMYSDGKLTDIADPNTIYSINDAGYVTKRTESLGEYTVYNYNAKNQPINEVTYNAKGEKTREDAHEFSATPWKIPNSSISMKGHPSIPVMYGDYSFLESKYRVTYYRTPGAKPDARETVYTHEVDRNGNLTRKTGTVKFGKTANEGITEYTYVGCR